MQRRHCDWYADLFAFPLTKVRGKRRKDTVLICLSQDDVEEGKVALNKGKLRSPIALTASREKQLRDKAWRSRPRFPRERHQIRKEVRDPT